MLKLRINIGVLLFISIFGLSACLETQLQKDPTIVVIGNGMQSNTNWSQALVADLKTESGPESYLVQKQALNPLKSKLQGAPDASTAQLDWMLSDPVSGKVILKLKEPETVVDPTKGSCVFFEASMVGRPECQKDWAHFSFRSDVKPVLGKLGTLYFVNDDGNLMISRDWKNTEMLFMGVKNFYVDGDENIFFEDLKNIWYLSQSSEIASLQSSELGTNIEIFLDSQKHALFVAKAGAEIFGSNPPPLTLNSMDVAAKKWTKLSQVDASLFQPENLEPLAVMGDFLFARVPLKDFSPDQTQSSKPIQPSHKKDALVYFHAEHSDQLVLPLIELEHLRVESSDTFTLFRDTSMASKTPPTLCYGYRKIDSTTQISDVLVHCQAMNLPLEGVVSDLIIAGKKVAIATMLPQTTPQIISNSNTTTPTAPSVEPAGRLLVFDIFQKEKDLDLGFSVSNLVEAEKEILKLRFFDLRQN